MSTLHPATLPLDRLLRDCDEQRTRRSGPGGQHRNKVETAVILTHRTTGIRAEAGERRSQAENREVALFRLRVNLALQIRTGALPEASPSPLWESRCRGGKVLINPQHDDFPALLAEALDLLASSNWDVQKAAGALGCTATQLARFLQLEPRAFLQLNEKRVERGLRRLQ